MSVRVGMGGWAWRAAAARLLWGLLLVVGTVETALVAGFASVGLMLHIEAARAGGAVSLLLLPLPNFAAALGPNAAGVRTVAIGLPSLLRLQLFNCSELRELELDAPHLEILSVQASDQRRCTESCSGWKEAFFLQRVLCMCMLHAGWL